MISIQSGVSTKRCSCEALYPKNRLPSSRVTLRDMMMNCNDKTGNHHRWMLESMGIDLLNGSVQTDNKQPAKIADPGR